MEVTQLSGKVIGKYALQEVIGQGGMAVVYRALHTDFDLPVAVKLVLPVLAGDASVRARFRREARLLFRLRHPHLVRVWEIVDEGHFFGMAMDWVEGEDLRGYLRKLTEALSIQQLKQIFLPILAAVGYAHKEKVIHRDLKPSNVLLEIHGEKITPKVMDFGIAKTLEGTDTSTHLHTSTSSVLGTPHYTAPEQIQGASEVDHRADIYSLGATLFQMLTGRLPFQHKASLQQVLFAQVMETPPSPRTFAPDLPLSLEDVILTALAKDPAKRYQTCEDFSLALLEALHETADTKRLTSSFLAIQEAVLSSSHWDAQNPPLSSSTPAPLSIPKDALPTGTGDFIAVPSPRASAPPGGAFVLAPPVHPGEIAFLETITPSHLHRPTHLLGSPENPASSASRAPLSPPASSPTRIGDLQSPHPTPLPASERLTAEPFTRDIKSPKNPPPRPEQKSGSASFAAVPPTLDSQTEEAYLPHMEDPDPLSSPSSGRSWLLVLALVAVLSAIVGYALWPLASSPPLERPTPSAPPLSEPPTPSRPLPPSPQPAPSPTPLPRPTHPPDIRTSEPSGTPLLPAPETRREPEPPPRKRAILQLPPRKRTSSPSKRGAGSPQPRPRGRDLFEGVDPDEES